MALVPKGEMNIVMTTNKTEVSVTCSTCSTANAQGVIKVNKTEDPIMQPTCSTANAQGVIKVNKTEDPIMQPTCSTANAQGVIKVNKTEKPIMQPTCSTENADVKEMVSFPGNYNFQIIEPLHTVRASKNVDWTHSSMLSKYFVNLAKRCPIVYQTDVEPPPSSVVVARVMFKSVAFQTTNIACCPNHTDPNDELGDRLLIVDAEANRPYYPFYGFSANGHHNAQIPWGAEKERTVVYTFNCLNSCADVIRRRDIILCVELCAGNEVLGRAVTDIQIVTCPGRDRYLQETTAKKLTAVKPTATAAESRKCRFTVQPLNPDEPFPQQLRVKYPRTAEGRLMFQEFMAKVSCLKDFKLSTKD